MTTFSRTFAALSLLFVWQSPAATRGWRSGESSVREARDRLAAGNNHTCAALYDGSVRCWGFNAVGQLGNNTEIDSTVPVTVVEAVQPAPLTRPLSGAIAVAAGQDFSCALMAIGRVYCWGINTRGQLGDGGLVRNSTKAIRVQGLQNVVRLVAGRTHACALLADGTVRCWGGNAGGQLGDGSKTNRTLPVPVQGLSGVTDIAAGNLHTCAAIPGSNVRCWGNNTFGQLGTNDFNESTTPAISGAIDPFVLAAGGDHACAVLAFGETRCWGRNDQGQLGLQDTNNRNTPITVSFLPDAATVKAGGSHTCAIAASGIAKCWGRNDSGQLGNNETVPPLRTAPVTVSGLSLGIGLSVGGIHTCAMTADGGITCWGNGVSGKLGNGDTQNRLVPAPVTGLTNGGVVAKAVAAGSDHVCALRANGTVSCWGSNDYGRTGLGHASVVPTEDPTLVPGLTGVSAISLANTHSCALIADGTVRCWGLNNFGQVGLPASAPTSSSSPVPLPLVTNAVGISAGSQHTCALTVDGSVNCWGRNASGQLGDGTTQDRHLPASSLGVSRVIRLAVGSSHTCVLQSSGVMQCWGRGDSGEQGDGGSTAVNAIPDIVPNLPAAADIAAGSFSTCASDRSGSLRCWGRNSSGQLGTGTQTSEEPLPVAISLMPAGTMVSLEFYNGCGLRPDGVALCWGSNSFGANGNGTTTGFQLNPGVVQNIGSLSQVSIGGRFGCAVAARGALFCWGNNFDKQLGGGDSGSLSTVPVAVPSFTLNIAPTAQLSNGRQVAVTIVANCAAGDQLSLRAQVRQASGAAGHGNQTVACTSRLATFPVDVVAQGTLLFAPGAATVEAEGDIRTGSGEQTVQRWTRAVQIVAP